VNVCTFADLDSLVGLFTTTTNLVVVVKRPTSDGQSKISRVFNFAILGYSRISQKLDACE